MYTVPPAKGRSGKGQKAPVDRHTMRSPASSFGSGFSQLPIVSPLMISVPHL
jgi:hypothetical protein